MAELHKKIIAEHLQGRTTLLTPDEKEFIYELENKILGYHQRFLEIKATEKEAQEIMVYLDEQNLIVANLCEHIRNKVFFSISEDLDTYKHEVTTKLQDLRRHANKAEVIAFLNQLIQECGSAEGDRYDLEEVYLNTLDNIIADFFEGFDEGEQVLVDYSKLRDLHTQSLKQSNIITDCSNKIADLNAEVAKFKELSGHSFDLDNEFQLAKISKKNNPISYSVLYVGSINSPENRQAYVLYRGKEQILGQGKNGLFKLCQNMQTGDWAAVKILSEDKYRDSEFETEVLDEVGRLYGVNARNDKQYIVQELLNGKELTTHLAEEETSSLESRLDIARQAIALVKEFNTQFLHRDIKPDNFIWDAQSQTLYLCDFGYSCRLGYESYDLAGSPDFIAPEIEYHDQGSLVPYSVKSETYALGKTLELVFANVENVPEEVSQIIREMSAYDPDKRFAGDYAELLVRFDDIQNLVSVAKPV